MTGERPHGHAGWRAAVTAGGRRTNFGTFHTEEEVARTYDATARERHGTFARLNFPGTPRGTGRRPDLNRRSSGHRAELADRMEGRRSQIDPPVTNPGRLCVYCFQ